MQSRPYQTRARSSILRAWRDHDRVLLVMATGTGKTVTFGMLVRELSERASLRCLILAHREELIQQIEGTFDKLGVSSVGVVQRSRNEIDRRVVIASVASLHAKRRAAVGAPFDVVIIDEAHHAQPDNSYGEILEWADSLAARHSRPCKVLGVTATPYRGDDKALDGVFATVAYRYTLPDAVRDGFLAPLRAFQVRTNVSLDEVKTQAGDFSSSALSAVVNTRNMNELVADAYLRYCRGERAIAFCVDVAHAQALTAAMVSKGIKARCVWGAQPNGERRAAIEALRLGEIDCVCNCMVLTEGFDLPELAAVLLCRPTMSRPLHMQQIGRVTRLAEGKRHGTVLDFTFNTRRMRHRIASLSDLEIPGLIRDGEFEPSDGQPRTVFVEIKPRGQGLKSFKVEIFTDSDHPIAWTEHRSDSRVRRFAATKELGAIIDCLPPSSTAPARWLLYIVPMRAKSPQVRRSFHANLRAAVHAAEEELAGSEGLQFATSSAAWKSNAPTEAQLRAAKRWKVRIPAKATSGEVSSLLGYTIALARIRKWVGGPRWRR
jgi:superfamily II DNA or RNA helicase